MAVAVMAAKSQSIESLQSAEHPPRRVQDSKTFELSKGAFLSLRQFGELVRGRSSLSLSTQSIQRLDETRAFIDDLLARKEKVYGLTTGFADLRNFSVLPEEAAQLSVNIIRSHDAGIGESLPKDIVLGAMICRANALSRGQSGFTKEGLQTLIQMINHKIIPLVPRYGSLGASGDLAFLARLGRAMMGEDVQVYYNDQIMSAKDALKSAGIAPFEPKAKEGLALTNGTSFMASMLAIGFAKHVHEMENYLAIQGLFFNAIQAIDAAFYGCIQDSRKQDGQKEAAKMLSLTFKDSPFIDHTGVQNDYSTRCLPQILGPHIEELHQAFRVLSSELNAVTDNPLIFSEDEITDDVAQERIRTFNSKRWAVLSGGNFHGQYITKTTDGLAQSLSKIAQTVERQMTFLLNPDRNKKFPPYLIPGKKVGLLSGSMIVQYAGNSLTQRICQLAAAPFSCFNITSGNESEDVVSYGAEAAMRLLEQQKLFRNLNVTYFNLVLQAYSITRQKLLESGIKIDPNLMSEKIFSVCMDELKLIGVQYPLKEDQAFDRIYECLDSVLDGSKLRDIIGRPLALSLSQEGEVP